MQKQILFKLPNRYGIPVGETRHMDIGVAELLVQRNIAEYWPPVTSVISEPVASAEDAEPKDTPKRRKRSESIEE